MQTNAFVLYHDKCMDGLGAKYAAWSRLEKNPDYITQYIPVQYNQPVPLDKISTKIAFSEVLIGESFFELTLNKSYLKISTTEAQEQNVPSQLTGTPNGPSAIEFGELDEVAVIRNVEVYIVDFSYPKDVLENLNTLVNKLVVLDHHKTAYDELKDLDYAIFDLNKSGAVLAWEYFHPNESVPKLLLHVQDRDLWQFKLPHTEQIVISISTFSDNMRMWDLYCKPQNTETPYKESLLHLKEVGYHLMDYRQNEIEKILKEVHVIQYKGHRVGVCSCTNFLSEVGHAIYENEELDVDYSMTYFLKDSTQATLSFRSSKTSGIDVSQIASELGGGGHPNASGAVVPVQTLLEIISSSIPD